MKKKYLVLLLIFLSLILIYMYFYRSTFEFENSTTNKGIQFSLITDKQSYRYDESFTAEMRVRILRPLPFKTGNYLGCQYLPTLVEFDDDITDFYEINIVDSKNTINPMSGCIEDLKMYRFYPGQVLYETIQFTPKKGQSMTKNIQMNAHFHGANAPFSITIIKEKK